ncbi:hypothetical protein B9Z55_024905 [Caenorhabditis nigoni]|uniref:Tc1-like transposase DDE domain-containing protein n=1 Tax=Caenorhabditis nigoni TaxID=1611254 RepID=A0A2G5SWA9_9PELO|nr:hypothetical protein B9Z55_024905 [Caenorhabditis nigoni]
MGPGRGNRQNRHQRRTSREKVILSIWLVSEGIIFDCTQMEKVFQAYQLSCPKKSSLLMIDDNARPPTTSKTRQKLQMLGVKVFCHPPFSSDLALIE